MSDEHPAWLDDPVMLLEAAYAATLMQRWFEARGLPDPARMGDAAVIGWLALLQHHTGLSDDWIAAMLAARHWQGSPVREPVASWVSRRVSTTPPPDGVLH